MNFLRVVLAALAAWLVYLGTGFLIHGVMLADLWETLQRDGVARMPAGAHVLMPISVVMALVGSFAFAYTYAKGYEGGPGLQEGLRFGVLVGLLFVTFVLGWNYVMFPLPLQYLTSMAAATVIQFAVLGMAVGIIYRK